MKKIKNYLYLIISTFVFTLCLGSVNATNYVNYFNISMTNQEYNNLLSLGFSEEEIYYMSENTYNNNKDLSGKVIAENHTYYKTIYTDLNGNSQSQEITENEYNNQSEMAPRGYVDTEYKHMVSLITELTNTYRYKVNVAWKNFPTVRSYDAIGIGFDDPVYISSPMIFEYIYCPTGGEYIETTQYAYRQATSIGGSYVYKLPSESITSLSTLLYFEVSKNTTDTITTLEMYGDYAHATSPVTYSIYSNHAISRGGLDFGANNGYYDAIPCAYSNASVNW